MLTNASLFGMRHMVDVRFAVQSLRHDYGSMLDEWVNESLHNDVHDATTAMADVEMPDGAWLRIAKVETVLLRHGGGTTGTPDEFES